MGVGYLILQQDSRDQGQEYLLQTLPSEVLRGRLEACHTVTWTFKLIATCLLTLEVADTAKSTYVLLWLWHHSPRRIELCMTTGRGFKWDGAQVWPCSARSRNLLWILRFIGKKQFYILHYTVQAILGPRNSLRKGVSIHVSSMALSYLPIYLWDLTYPGCSRISYAFKE